MKRRLLIGGCAIVGGILAGTLLHKCVDKITENKSEEDKKTVDKVVMTTLITAEVVAVMAYINKRINTLSNNTELCFVYNVLNTDLTNSETIEALNLLKGKFVSPKVLEFIDSTIKKLEEE